MNAMTLDEMAQVEGGIVPVVTALIWLSGVLVGATVSNVLENWPEFKKGVMEGYNRTTASN